MLKYQSILLFLLCVLTTACMHHPYMQRSTKTDADIKPSPETSLVIFLRPSGYASNVSAAIYDITNEQNIFIGLAGTKTKVAYELSPGEYTFMVTSEAADFMSAHLEAGKTYYAYISARMGNEQTRFSFRPINQYFLKSPDFKIKEAECALIDNTEQSHAWAKQNEEHIDNLRHRYFAKWMSKPSSKRPRLTPEDGRI